MIGLLVSTMAMGGLIIIIPRLIYLFIWSLVYGSMRRPVVSIIAAVLMGLLFDLWYVLPMGQMAVFFLCTVGFFELYGTVFHNKNLLFVNIYVLLFSLLGYVIVEERVTVMFLAGYVPVAVLMSSLVARKAVRTV